MNKEDQLKKNKLDLDHQKYSQLLNGIFIFATTGLIAFIGSFIWLKDKNALFIGISISSLILIFSYLSYKKIDAELERIKNEIVSI